MKDKILKEKAVALIKIYLDMNVTAQQINILESNQDGTYLFFSVGKSSISYLYINAIDTTFCMYPNKIGVKGMELETIKNWGIINVK